MPDLEEPPPVAEGEPDTDAIPEWTDDDFARAVPFAEAHPEAFDTWKKSRGRPKVHRPKAYIGFRFTADVVEAVKAGGRGYNGRVEKVLREAIAKGLI